MGARSAEVRDRCRVAVREVSIVPDHIALPGTLAVAPDAIGVVVFAQSSSRGRHVRDLHVARVLDDARLGTLLFDLLTPDEALDRRHVFDVPLLAERLRAAVEWLQWQPEARHVPTGILGTGSGAAAGVSVAADLGDAVGALVSRGGRPDLAGGRLGDVSAPTLLVVGGLDDALLQLNRLALRELRCPAALEVVPGATHRFEEPGALETVAQLAAAWFSRHLE